jgi:hypothetical protein
MAVEPPRDGGIALEPRWRRKVDEGESALPERRVRAPEAFVSAEVRETGVDSHAGACGHQQRARFRDGLRCTSNVRVGHVVLRSGQEPSAATLTRVSPLGASKQRIGPFRGPGISADEATVLVLVLVLVLDFRELMLISRN